MKNKIVKCNGIEISNHNKICLISGPCQLETEQHAIDMAGKIKEIANKFQIGFIYKTSFDKANRTSLKGKRGIGLEKSSKTENTLEKCLPRGKYYDNHKIYCEDIMAENKRIHNEKCKIAYQGRTKDEEEYKKCIDNLYYKIM